MLLDLVTPLNIILSIVFALVLVNVLKVTWLVLIPVYIIIACLIIVINTYTKSPRGQREKAERDE